MFEIVKKILGQTNEYGVPIPLLLLVLILYRIIVSKIDRWNEREKYYSELVENLGI